MWWISADRPRAIYLKLPDCNSVWPASKEPGSPQFLSNNLATIPDVFCLQAKNQDLAMEASQLEEERLNAEQDNIK